MTSHAIAVDVFEEILPCDVAHHILGDYLRYHHQYKRINKRAKLRFERRDWQGIQSDSNERISQYSVFVDYTTLEIRKILGDRIDDYRTWKEIRNLYFEEIINFNTRNIAETYFNSVFRHCHRGTQEMNEELMFVQPSVNYHGAHSPIPIYHTIFINQPIRNAISQILHCYDLSAPFEDAERDISRIAEILEKRLALSTGSISSIRLELVKSLFFRNKCAYIVGRLVVDHKVQPFIVPLLHEEKGVYVDAVLLDQANVSSIFSYSRSYFLTDTDIAGDMVDFLHSILPSKALSELYNSLGFIKHAKTEFYREFKGHMRNTEDQFIIAPGIKGMVMTVFSLPSYNMVFKIIKDRFDPPKKVTERIVKEKYNLVAMHDRVGRMVDSHMFHNLVFDKSRFSAELLEELKRTCSSKLKITEDTIEISHLYIEKKMIPLNIYMSNVNDDEQSRILADYTQAIKELARVNIFPGDLLLKNFGVTKRKKVVFYDYDEIEFVTNLNFKNIPKSKFDEDDMMDESWFTPDLNDIFPEQFPAFIVGSKLMQKLLLSNCPEIFESSFWKSIQLKLKKNIIISVFPYPEELRFCNMIQEPIVQEAAA